MLEFQRNVISTWSSGTGGAGILGSFSYAALISLGLSPFTTILLMTTIPVIEALTFWMLLRNPNSIPKQNSEPKYRQTLDNQENGILSSKAKLSLGDKIRCLPSLMKYLVPFLLIFLFQYFINQGLVSVKNENRNSKHFNIFSIFKRIFLYISRWNWFISKVFGWIMGLNIAGYK